MMDKKVLVYRAINGPGFFINGQLIYQGVTDEELRKSGLFTANLSLVHAGDATSWRQRQLHPDTYRKVPGLPVYLDLSPAIFWLQGKRYGETPPAIIAAELPYELLFGPNPQIQIVNHGLDPKDNKILQEKDFINRDFPYGEFFIHKVGSHQVPNIPRRETILRPSCLEKGFIVVEKGFKATFTKEVCSPSPEFGF